MILTFLFVTCYGLGLLLPVLVCKRLGVRLSVVSLLSVFFLSYYVFAYVGLLPLYFHLDPMSLSMGLTDRSCITAMLGFAILTLGGVLAGFAATKALLPALRPRLQGPLLPLPALAARTVTVGLVGCTLVAAFLVLTTPHIALFEALRGRVDEVAWARSQMTNARPTGGFDWQRLFYIDGFQFLLFSLFAQVLAQRRRMDQILLAVFIPMGLACAYLTMQKHDAIFLLLGLGLTYLLARHDGRVSPRLVAVFLPILAAVLIIPYLASYAGSVSQKLESLVERVFVGSLFPAYFYLKIFPTQHAFLHGTSLSNLLGLLPFQQFPLTRFVYDAIYHPPLDSGIVGTAPTVFWAEAYANFGWTGPLWVGCAVGGMIYALHWLLHHLDKSPSNIALTAWIILHIQFLSITSFSNYLVNQHLAIVIVLWLLITWCDSLKPLVINHARGRRNKLHKDRSPRE